MNARTTRPWTFSLFESFFGHIFFKSSVETVKNGSSGVDKIQKTHSPKLPAPELRAFMNEYVLLAIIYCNIYIYIYIYIYMYIYVYLG
jgi:hypothetical protein